MWISFKDRFLSVSRKPGYIPSINTVHLMYTSHGLIHFNSAFTLNVQTLRRRLIIHNIYIQNRSIKTLISFRRRDGMSSANRNIVYYINHNRISANIQNRCNGSRRMRLTPSVHLTTIHRLRYRRAKTPAPRVVFFDIRSEKKI